ncbi:MAG TPA: hypothetical protein VL383_17660 [Gemmatimonadaceae bacterium]|jgi:hypothetical protein|nr:hypothetical protein [Gemmatimonadaceae bacterium]
MVRSHGTIRDGLVVGLIGYAAVALFYSAFDALAARDPLYTVDLLGKAVFRGLRDPGVLSFPVALDGMAIFLYNALHLAIALVIGIIVTALAGEAERHPGRARLVLFTLIAGFVVTVAIVGLLTTPMRPVLPWWSIVVANALAVIVAGSYLVRQRPHLWHRLTLVAG